MSHYGESSPSVNNRSIAVWAVAGIVAVTFIVGSCAYVKPRYNVWAAEMEGAAELAQAEQNRKITVLEAEAKLESAKALSAAEIERAKGVAEANRIIGESLKGNESYLRYLWIQNLESGSNSVVYVPTEAGLPILEAGKRKD
jgi:regulator of protease activity HflC (stomatin/prohibitin superfamily)